MLVAAAPLSENQATDLVFKAVHQAYPRESLRCFSLMTEARTRRQFDIAVRENHGGRCGGDPDTMPVRDRFRVSRWPVRLARWNALDDTYRPCRLTAAHRPIC